MNMKKIYIGFSRKKSFNLGSRLISWWNKTPYSHVYCKWYLSTQCVDIVYHAANNMVHFKEYNSFKKENLVVVEINLDITDEQFIKFSRKCILLTGQPYSFIELVQIFIHDLTFGKFRCNDQPGYICSELLGELMIDLGYSFNKPTYLITPTDIYNKMSQWQN